MANQEHPDDRGDDPEERDHAAIAGAAQERVGELEDAVDEQEDAGYHGEGRQAVTRLDQDDHTRHDTQQAHQHHQPPAPTELLGFRFAHAVGHGLTPRSD